MHKLAFIFSLLLGLWYHVRLFTPNGFVKYSQLLSAHTKTIQYLYKFLGFSKEPAQYLQSQL